jgi:hypothetical protein
MRIVKPEFFLTEPLIPMGFKYPVSYVNFIKGELCDLDPWIFLDDEELVLYYDGLKERYHYKEVLPFACRLDNDDVACFDASVPSDDPKVLIIHDFASPGWEGRGECENFLEWLELAKLESREYKAYLEFGPSPQQKELYRIRVYLSKKSLPKGFDYPVSYRQFISRILRNLEMANIWPWKFFGEELNKKYLVLNLKYYLWALILCFMFGKRYQPKKLVPIFYKIGSSDIACFEYSKDYVDPGVVIIDSSKKVGEEVKERYGDFECWLISIGFDVSKSLEN